MTIKDSVKKIISGTKGIFVKERDPAVREGILELYNSCKDGVQNQKELSQELAKLNEKDRYKFFEAIFRADRKRLSELDKETRDKFLLLLERQDKLIKILTAGLNDKNLDAKRHAREALEGVSLFYPNKEVSQPTPLSPKSPRRNSRTEVTLEEFESVSDETLEQQLKDLTKQIQTLNETPTNAVDDVVKDFNKEFKVKVEELNDAACAAKETYDAYCTMIEELRQQTEKMRQMELDIKKKEPAIKKNLSESTNDAKERITEKAKQVFQKTLVNLYNAGFTRGKIAGFEQIPLQEKKPSLLLRFFKKMPNCWPFRSKRNKLEAGYQIRNGVIDVANKLRSEPELQIEESITPLRNYLNLYITDVFPLSDKVMKKEFSEGEKDLQKLCVGTNRNQVNLDKDQTKISKDLEDGFAAQIEEEQATPNRKVVNSAQRKNDLESALNELKNKYQELRGLIYPTEEHIFQYADKLAEYKEAWLSVVAQLSKQLNELERNARDKGKGNWLDSKYNELEETRKNIKLLENRISTTCYFDIQKRLGELCKPQLEKCPNKEKLDELMEELNSNPEQLAQVYNLTRQWVVNYTLQPKEIRGSRSEAVVNKGEPAEVKKLQSEKPKIDETQNINAVIDALKEIGNYLGTKKTRLLSLCRSKTFPMKQKIYQRLIELLKINMPNGKQTTMGLQTFCVEQLNKMDSETRKKSKKFRTRLMNLFEAFDKFNDESFKENFVSLSESMAQVFMEQEKLLPNQKLDSDPVPNGCKQLQPGVYKVVCPQKLTDYVDPFQQCSQLSAG